MADGRNFGSALPLNSTRNEVSTYQCASCKARVTTLSGIVQSCMKCQGYMCSNCSKTHEHRKEGQEVIYDDDMSTRDKHEYCIIHRSEILTDYCKTHNSLLCKICKIDHGVCADVQSIEDACQGLIVSGKADEMIQDLNELNRKLKFFNELRNKDLQNLNSDKDNALKQVRKLRYKVREVFDRLEQNLEQEITQTFQEQSNPIGSHLVKIQTEIKTLTENICKLSESFSSGNERRLFLAMQRIRVQQTLQFYQDLQKNRKSAEIRFQPDHKILARLKKIRNLGKLTTRVKHGTQHQDIECSNSQQTELSPSDEGGHGGIQSEDQQLDQGGETRTQVDTHQPDIEHIITVQTETPVVNPGLLATVIPREQPTELGGSTRTQVDTQQNGTGYPTVIQAESLMSDSEYLHRIHPSDPQSSISTQTQNIQVPDIFIHARPQQSSTSCLTRIQTEDPASDPRYRQPGPDSFTRIQTDTQQPSVEHLDSCQSVVHRISDGLQKYLVSIQARDQYLDLGSATQMELNIQVPGVESTERICNPDCPVSIRPRGYSDPGHSTGEQMDTYQSGPEYPTSILSTVQQSRPQNLPRIPHLNMDCGTIISSGAQGFDPRYQNSIQPGPSNPLVTQSSVQQSGPVPEYTSSNIFQPSLPQFHRHIQFYTPRLDQQIPTTVQSSAPSSDPRHLVSVLTGNRQPRPEYGTSVQSALSKNMLVTTSTTKFTNQFLDKVSPDVLPITNRKADQYNQLTGDLREKKLEKTEEFYVPEAGDRYKSSITGSVFLADDTFLICDYINGKVKHLDSDMKITSSIKLSGRPFDISLVSQQEAVVTIPSLRQLQYLSITPLLRKGRTVSLETECYGVTLYNNNLYVSCEDPGEVLVMDHTGRILRKYGDSCGYPYLFECPDFVAIGDDGIIYVSDADSATITAVRPEGGTIYKYMNENLLGPQQLLVDNTGHVYVSGMWSSNIQIITPEGQLYKELTKEGEGLKNPMSMAYRASDKTLAVWCYRDKFRMYKFMEV